MSIGCVVKNSQKVDRLFTISLPGGGGGWIRVDQVGLGLTGLDWQRRR